MPGGGTGCTRVEAGSIRAVAGHVERNRGAPENSDALNWAVHVVFFQRARHDEATRAYIERRRKEGTTTREIRRCLKRYITRERFNLLEHPLDSQ